MLFSLTWKLYFSLITVISFYFLHSVHFSFNLFYIILYYLYIISFSFASYSSIYIYSNFYLVIISKSCLCYISIIIFLKIFILLYDMLFICYIFFWNLFKIINLSLLMNIFMMKSLIISFFYFSTFHIKLLNTELSSYNI